MFSFSWFIFAREVRGNMRLRRISVMLRPMLMNQRLHELEPGLNGAKTLSLHFLESGEELLVSGGEEVPVA